MTPPGGRGARPANEGLCPRNNTCARMRYALTPAAADFVRFAGLLCAGWYKLQGGGRKRAKREILRKIWKCENFVVSLPKIFETMTKIKQDRRNYRVHNDENKRVIRKSLEELGAGRSIVIDNEGEIIAGNGVYEQAQKLGIKTKIVETDGSELVVVKRTDLATGDDKRKKLALADNAASDTSEWADELLREDWTPEVLADWGVELPEVVYEQGLKQILDDADFESLNDVARERTGMRQICFVMQAEHADVVNAYIKKHGKEELIAKIVELCQQQEVK